MSEQSPSSRSGKAGNTDELLDVLCCPSCKGDLEPLDGGAGLSCASCAVVYPVREGIPVMLVQEAVPLDRWGADKA